MMSGHALHLSRKFWAMSLPNHKGAADAPATIMLPLCLVLHNVGIVVAVCMLAVGPIQVCLLTQLGPYGGLSICATFHTLHLHVHEIDSVGCRVRGLNAATAGPAGMAGWAAKASCMGRLHAGGGS